MFLKPLGALFGPLGALFGPLGALFGPLRALLGPLGGVLGESWGLLGRSLGGRLAQLDFCKILGLILDRFWSPKGSRKGSKMDPKTDQHRE